jgi:hypothetical protein
MQMPIKKKRINITIDDATHAAIGATRERLGRPWESPHRKSS